MMNLAEKYYIKIFSFILIIIPIVVSSNSFTTEVEPLVWHDYEYFDLTLPPGYCKEFSRYPYAVSVHISTLTPSGYKVDVTITVNGVLKWGDQLGAGESSPTITCNDNYTEVHIANPNGSQETVHVTGYIDWVMH